MHKMSLPSLHAIRAFEAAGRLGSFTRAAAELGLTQSAVSRHIRLLEDQLAIKLFDRRGRQVLLTRRGSDYHEVISTALASIRRASYQSSDQASRNLLRISTQPSIAALWLIPRLDKFKMSFPGIEVAIDATRERVDFDIRYCDVCIRYGNGNWPEGATKLLCGEKLVPVCSRQYADEQGLWNDPGRLEHARLFNDEWQDDWPRWFEAAGLDPVAAHDGVTFDESASLYEAVQAGAGVALGRWLLVEGMLVDGRLVSPIDVMVPSQLSYWTVTPPRGELSPAARQFVRWLEVEVSVDSDPSALDQVSAESLG